MQNLLRHLLSFFKQERIDHALIGAFALKAYGHVRATRDVDFLVRVKDQDKLVVYLESIGYETLYRSNGFSSHLHPLSILGRINFVYVEGNTADLVFSEAKPLFVFDRLSIPVVKAEHLVALKVFAMKNDPERLYQEMADLYYLLKLPEIDLEEVQRYFEKYGQLEKYIELTEK